MDDLQEDVESVKNGEITAGKDEKGKFTEGNKFGKGRPRGLSLTEAIRQRLKELTPDQKRTALDFLADNIIQDALDHDNSMRKLIWNYLDGMPAQGLEITGNVDMPFIVKLIRDDRGTTETTGIGG